MRWRIVAERAEETGEKRHAISKTSPARIRNREEVACATLKGCRGQPPRMMEGGTGVARFEATGGPRRRCARATSE